MFNRRREYAGWFGEYTRTNERKNTINLIPVGLMLPAVDPEVAQCWRLDARP